MHGSVSEFCLERNRGNFGEWTSLYNNQTDPFLERWGVGQDGHSWGTGDSSVREVRGGNWRCGQGGSFTAKPCHSGYSGLLFVLTATATSDWCGFRPAITKNNELNKY